MKMFMLCRDNISLCYNTHHLLCTVAVHNTTSAFAFVTDVTYLLHSKTMTRDLIDYRLFFVLSGSTSYPYAARVTVPLTTFESIVGFS